MRASRLGQRHIGRRRRLAPIADLYVRPLTPIEHLTGNAYDQICACKSIMVSKLTRHNPGVHVGRPGWHLSP